MLIKWMSSGGHVVRIGEMIYIYIYLKFQREKLKI